MLKYIFTAIIFTLALSCSQRKDKPLLNVNAPVTATNTSTTSDVEKNYKSFAQVAMVKNWMHL